MISALIPAYNEAARIATTVAAARRIEGVEEIVVLDDGSTDDTSICAEAAGADIVLRQKNAGKGAALQAAYQMSNGDTLLLLDADLGETASEARKLVGPILTGAADMTIANFVGSSAKGGGVGLVVRLARWGIERLTGRRMQAPLSGQRAVRREVIECVGGFAAGWGAEVALTVDALRLGYRVIEVDVAMTHRVTGRNIGGIVHRARQFFAVLAVLARLRRVRRPCRDVTAAGSGEGKQRG
jgi:glycosyltransferase involved in cell wall biosynthesis